MFIWGTAFLLCFPIAGCPLVDENEPPNVSGTYVLELKSAFGTTSDTIEVTGERGNSTYQVTHKVAFVPNEHDRQHQRTYRIEKHLAIFEEHAGTLRDIDDGTVFLINYKESFEKYRKGYRRLNKKDIP
ncbi:MAG: hypothetical protein EOP49_00070 [Sphingobacteriales bacterium]|nr:MAG: hypothetical protein EOP49_00070 [Sphingobacteriales bacterium]